MGGVIPIQGGANAAPDVAGTAAGAADFGATISVVLKDAVGKVLAQGDVGKVGDANLLQSLSKMVFPTELTLAPGAKIPDSAKGGAKPEAGKDAKAESSGDIGGLVQLAGMLGIPGGPVISLLSQTDTGKSVMGTASKVVEDVTHLDPVHLVTDLGEGVFNAGKSIVNDIGKIGGSIISGIGKLFGF